MTARKYENRVQSWEIAPGVQVSMREGEKPKARGYILLEAHKVINGERQDDYGKPEDSFQIIADYWNVYLKHHVKNRVLEPYDVAYLMELFKRARDAGQKYNPDNDRDGAGYIGIGNSLRQKGACQ